MIAKEDHEEGWTISYNAVDSNRLTDLLQYDLSKFASFHSWVSRKLSTCPTNRVSASERQRRRRDIPHDIFHSLVDPVSFHANHSPPLLLVPLQRDDSDCKLYDLHPAFSCDGAHSRQRLYNHDGAHQAGQHSAPGHKASCRVYVLYFIIASEDVAWKKWLRKWIKRKRWALASGKKFMWPSRKLTYSVILCVDLSWSSKKSSNKIHWTWCMYMMLDD